MSIKQCIWNRIYEKNKIVRNRHQNNLLFGECEGVFGKTKEIISLGRLNHKSNAKIKFPEYSVLYDIDLFKKKILENEVISFDIFDTLLLRPFCRPTDLFYLLEYKNGIPNFRELRIRAEQYARKITVKKNGEVNIFDIYNVLQKWCHIDPKAGVEQEIELESQLCFAHPFVSELYQYAIDHKKEVIVTSDMYIPSDKLRVILEKKGFLNLTDIYVSCDYEASKYAGQLPKLIREKYGNKKILHIGDNKHSDYVVWKNYAEDSILLYNVNQKGMNNRLFAETTIQGSVYAGIVNAFLYNGFSNPCKNPYFEYGYVYGGILTLGFCQWLNSTVQHEKADKILFLARDCKIIKEIYDIQYPKENNTYFLTSRIALLPILCELSFDTFVDEAFKARLLYENMTILQTFRDLDLETVSDTFCLEGYTADMHIQIKDWNDFKQKIFSFKEEIRKVYCEKYINLKKYISQQIGNCKKIMIVDLGWRGSSIIYLKYMIEKEFPGISVIGAMLGTLDCSLSRMRICDSTIYSYLFSPNDSVYEKVNGKTFLYADERLYLEYMYTDVINSVIGYSCEEDGTISEIYETKDINKNSAMVIDMHAGIRQFVKDYNEYLGPLKDVIVLDKETAYSPMYRLLQTNKSLKRFFVDFNEKKSTVHGYLKE